ncbi:MAG: hypothetical protein JWM10_4977, partial [Myxococcaceae bacterium]|nr:hypothetical protein [Myxococcaceae bacterium]
MSDPPPPLPPELLALLGDAREAPTPEPAHVDRV